MNAPQSGSIASRNIKHLAQLELAGAGQVYVDGQHAYIGHLTNKERLGTTILDISDPRKPRIVSQIKLDDRGLIYLVDRGPRFDVVEFTRG